MRFEVRSPKLAMVGLALMLLALRVDPPGAGAAIRPLGRGSGGSSWREGRSGGWWPMAALGALARLLVPIRGRMSGCMGLMGSGLRLPPARCVDAPPPSGQ